MGAGWLPNLVWASLTIWSASNGSPFPIARIARRLCNRPLVRAAKSARGVLIPTQTGIVGTIPLRACKSGFPISPLAATIDDTVTYGRPIEAPMTTIDLTTTQRKALLQGFWKGLAAPLMLFGSHSLPVQAQPGEFQPLPDRMSSPAQDWVRVGNSLRDAAKKDRENGGN
jgi:hypothetical protein